MNIYIKDKNLSATEKIEIKDLQNRKSNEINDSLEQIWHLIDLVWDDYGCDNKNLDWGKIGKFYSHPVWLLNGLFIEQHDVSMGHRHAISEWVMKRGFTNVVDYGGGFGTLARLIAEKDSKVSVAIYEPHPSEFGLKRASQFANIKIINRLDIDYDCLVSTDVLEHLSDPLKTLEAMIKSLKRGGYLVIANCFHPVIKCHLPTTFHLKYTFNLFAKLMGLTKVGILEESHATIFKKVTITKVNWSLVRYVEKLSKCMFRIIEQLHSSLRTIRRLFNK